MSITVIATAGDLSGSQEFSIPYNGGVADWSLSNPVAITSGGITVGTIRELTVQTDSDPNVNLHFSVDAGGTDTTFTFNSSLVSFASLTNPSAVASSSLTLTDTDGNGATIIGLEGNNNCYNAICNGSVIWASLNKGYTFTTPYDGEIETDRQPTGSGMLTIPDTVSSIQSQYSFVLSANDEASGTSTFNVTPEPATLSLLALGSLAMLRRRKS